MAKLSLHKPNTTLGPYKIVDLAGRDNRATLYLAERDDPDYRYWLMEFAEPLNNPAASEGQDLFDWKGNTVFVFPVSGTTAASISGLVQQMTWQFLTPRFGKVAEEMAVRHDKNQLYQMRGALGLDNFFFNADGQLSLYPASKQPNSPILPPEGMQNLTAASDVYVVGRALQTLLNVPPQEKALFKGNRTLDVVLARATNPDPHARYPHGLALALGLNGVVPSGAAKPNAAEDNSTPWVSGCLIPLILLIVLSAGGYFGYQNYAAQQVAAVQATATVRYTNNLVLATSIPTSGRPTIGDFLITENGGVLQATLTVLRDGTPITDGTPTFIVLHNEAVVSGVQTQAGGEGRYSMAFAVPLVEENFFRVIASVGNQNASATAYVFHSGVTGIDYGTSDISAAPLPAGAATRRFIPGDTVAISPPPLDPFDFPEVLREFRDDPNADPTGLDTMGDVTVQVDTTTYPKMTTYLSFRNSAGFPARLGSNINLRVYQDGVEISDFEVASVNAETDPLSAALLIDVSGSMEGEPIIRAREAAVAFVNQLNPNDSACLYSFATQVTLVQACTTDHATVIAAINALETRDDTALYDALIQVARDQDPLSGRQAMVVLSDGADTVSSAGLREAIDFVVEANIPLYLIGLVSEQFDGAVLAQLGTETNGVYLNTPTADQLGDLYLLIEVQLSNQYRLSFDSIFPDLQSGRLQFILEDSELHLEESQTFYAQ